MNKNEIKIMKNEISAKIKRIGHVASKSFNDYVSHSVFCFNRNERIMMMEHLSAIKTKKECPREVNIKNGEDLVLINRNKEFFLAITEGWDRPYKLIKLSGKITL